jgi:integrase
MGGKIVVSGRYLERRAGGVWYVSIYVPERARKTLGCRVLRRSLGTTDEAVALRLRDDVVAELRGQIEAGEGQDPMAVQSADTLATLLTTERARVRDLEGQLARLRQGIDWGEVELAKLNRNHPAITATTTVPTFLQATDRFIESRLNGKAWKHGEAAAKVWRASLRRHASSIAALPVDQISTSHIMRIMAAKPPVNLRLRIEHVLRYSKAMNWRAGDNPATVENLAIVPRGRVTHHPAMPYQDIPAFMATLAGRETVVADTLRFAILTVCRTSEAGGATWSEIDLNTATWAIPASRMKSGRQHVIPLSDAAMAILRARKAQELPRHGGHVFPSRLGNAGLGHSAIDGMLKRMRVDVTTHGFRASFRNWCAETGKPHDAAEFSLAHVKTGTEGAYFRTTMIEARRTLMQEWGEFCMSGI